MMRAAILIVAILVALANASGGSSVATPNLRGNTTPAPVNLAYGSCPQNDDDYAAPLGSIVSATMTGNVERGDSVTVQVVVMPAVSWHSASLSVDLVFAGAPLGGFSNTFDLCDALGMIQITNGAGPFCDGPPDQPVTITANIPFVPSKYVPHVLQSSIVLQATVSSLVYGIGFATVGCAMLALPTSESGGSASFATPGSSPSWVNPALGALGAVSGLLLITTIVAIARCLKYKAATEAGAQQYQALSAQ